MSYLESLERINWEEEYIFGRCLDCNGLTRNFKFDEALIPKEIDLGKFVDGVFQVEKRVKLFKCKCNKNA